LGEYTVQVVIRWPQGLEEATRQLSVTSADGKCNTDPSIHELYVRHQYWGTEYLVYQIEQDPAYRARLGDLTGIRVYTSYNGADYAVLAYPPLEDLIPLKDRLWKLNEFSSIWKDSYGCFPVSPPNSEADVVEFHNAELNHYFYTGDWDEITFVEGGGAGPWQRTGLSFRVVTRPGCAIAEPGVYGPIYRFIGTPGVGPNSHFFTASREECYVAKESGLWTYESSPFWAGQPQDGRCPDYLRPLYRVFNNRAAQNDANYRLTTDLSIVAAMVSQGWIDQGTVMCIAKPSRLPEGEVVEYVNTADFPNDPGGHYFYTADPAEQSWVDNGGAGRFVRTGASFKTGGSIPVCRFYGSVSPGPNSHFFTSDAGECVFLINLQRTPIPQDVQQWNYEGEGFLTSPPNQNADGSRSCMTGTVPVYRAYNSAFTPEARKNPWDSNHSFSTDHSAIEALTGLGWRDEGIAFCAPQ
jgi:hypothetical protein